MQIVLEGDSIDKPSDFQHLSATTNFSCKGVFNQNIWSQIPPRVCTLVLFIIRQFLADRTYNVPLFSVMYICDVQKNFFKYDLNLVFFGDIFVFFGLKSLLTYI